MIGWIVGIVTFILLLFILWRKSSKSFRESAEEPKYRFLESLGVPALRGRRKLKTNSPQGGQ
jgi:hypothetical protein